MFFASVLVRCVYSCCDFNSGTALIAGSSLTFLLDLLVEAQDRYDPSQHLIILSSFCVAPIGLILTTTTYLNSRNRDHVTSTKSGGTCL